MRDHMQPIGRLLADVDAHVLHFAILQQILSTFVDQKLRVAEQVALVFDEPVGSGSIRLFIRDRKKNHVTIERDLLTLEHHHHHQLRQPFVFHVLGAASP